MRTVPAIVVLLMAISTTQAKDWCELTMRPPILNPTPSVNYDIQVVPYTDFNWWCHATEVPVGWFSGCAVELGEDYWVIMLRDDLAEYEKECVLDHEKSHLPPVSWEHPTSPFWMDASGGIHMRTGPRVRRASHLKPWYFVSGRHGAKTQDLASTK